MPRIKIWTRAYNPFSFGGVNAPVTTETDALGPFDVGKGQSVYIVCTPDGDIRIAESATGAIVGYSLSEVREDVKTGDIAVIEKQIAEARKMVKHAQFIPESGFWSARWKKD